MTEQEKKMWADDVAMIGMLREEKEELQARIDKAIEYIDWSLEANEELTDMGIGLCVNNVEELLKILKGE